MQANGLKDKVVLVTAGASGIGKSISAAFLEQSARVHICDVDQAMINSCQKQFPGITASICDVSNANQVNGLISHIKNQYGRLDILINNAGVAGPTSCVEEIQIEDWEKTIAVNMSGTFMVTRVAVPMLKLSGCGSIVNMSSNAGLSGCPLRSPYVAAKWAVIGLTKTWAMELGRFGIRVNAICPGSVDGPRIERVIEQDALKRGVSGQEIRDIYQRQSSLRKFVSAQDIANMAVFICSDLGNSISGQSLGVDGNTESLSNWLD